ncbi:MAG: DUF3488 and transglutaminase-like domain-containing protein [Acidobacteriota bacterium]
MTAHPAMAFGREKRILLGLLALLAPLPLPLNETLGWSFLAIYLLGVVVFIRHAASGSDRWLSPWMMNVLGLLYLPLFVIDLRAFSGGRLVGPMLHLGLFAILIKLASLRRERDKWQALMGIFFVFLASMATSVHPSIVLFLLVFLAGGLYLLMRFAFLHLVAGFGQRDPALLRLPLGAFLGTSVLMTLVFSVPLFALLPRVSSPYVNVRGTGTGTIIQASGFSDEVTLDSIGRIRESRAVALRARFDDPARTGIDQRYKGATYDVYDGGSWRRSPRVRSFSRSNEGPVRLVEGAPESWATLWLRPLASRSLPLPTETRLFDIELPRLGLGTGGAVILPFPPVEVLEYRAALGGDDLSAALDPPAAGPEVPTLDPRGLTPAMRTMAAEVMGKEGTTADRIRRLESHLATQYTYTLDFVGREITNPLEDFLFRYKSGHCEYFASAMVLLLRAEGVHSRLVTGFLGGEVNPLEGYTIVRQSNAHAWVEAYIPDEGWRTFDPTPAAGRPESVAPSTWSLVTQAWDFLIFRWDRYVLTFGFEDQLQLFGSLKDLWARLWSPRVPATELPPPADVVPDDSPIEPLPELSPRRWSDSVWIVGGLVTATIALFWWLVRRRLRGPLTATGVYRRLRKDLAGAGLPVAESLAPLTLERRAGRRFPDLAEPMRRIVSLYLEESFGGRAVVGAARQELADALGQTRRGLRGRSAEG